MHPREWPRRQWCAADPKYQYPVLANLVLFNKQGVEGHFLEPRGRPLAQLSMSIIYNPGIFRDRMISCEVKIAFIIARKEIM